ncbi:MAG: peptidoglycan DD-metalloendopeptidase family protein [Ferruginibacter sp.]|nr:peptidoglycan DD-metalloendopeptidase family protein [Ferruginibacter sp.]
MAKIIVTFLSIFIFSTSLIAQAPPSKEQQDLERQRQQLKQDIEETQELLNKNKKVTKENMGTLALINKKLGLQENVLDNINRDINLLDNTIYKSQRDINKMQLLLDTLKQDYAKSMVYSYKNRSNSDFLNFIFSASSFNDAIKRITYLKSYRNYREMQGENILRTQDLLKSRINELSGNKKKKSAVLQTQSKEINVLQAQQEEKNDVVKKLKAQGKELNNQVAAKKKQMQKVNNAITAAIRRAIDEAKRASAAKNAEDKKVRDAEAKADAKALKNSTAANNNTDNNATKKIGKAPRKVVAAPVKQESVLLSTNAEINLNSNFIINRGKLPWPVDKGYILLHWGSNKVGPMEIVSQGLSIGCDIGTPVKIIFGGEVVLVNNYDDVQMVVVKHGTYFTAYSNLSGVNLNKGQTVQTGQAIGKVAANLDGIGAIDLMISNEKSDVNPELWLRRR